MSKIILYVTLAVCLVVALMAGDYLSFPGEQAAEAESLAAQFNARAKTNEDDVVVALTLRGKDVSDSVLSRLSAFPALASLDLTSTSITDDSLSELAGLTGLESISFDETAITDQGLAQLQHLPLKELSLAGTSPGRLTLDGIGKLQSLTSLNLSRCELSDDSAEALGSLKNLERLYLARTEMTSACLDSLSKLKNLKLLNLAELSLNNSKHIAAIAGMRSLEHLYLDNADIDDETLGALVKACGQDGAPLQSLFLEGCEITDQSRGSLEVLVTQPEFRKLRLTGTSVSRSAFDELRRAAPDVSYSHGDGGEAD